MLEKRERERMRERERDLQTEERETERTCFVAVVFPELIYMVGRLDKNC